MVKVSPYCVGWSVISNVTFGLTNFLISYTNVGGIDPWAVIGWIWFTSGLIGVLTGIYFWFKIGRVFFTAEYLEHALGKIQSRPNSDPEVGQSEYVYLCDGEKIYPQPHLKEISLRAKLLTLVGGMCVGLSQLMMKWAFATDPAASGPLTAVISSDILVIGVYCHFVYNEKLTWSQAVAILVVLGGLVVMGASFDSGVGGSALGFLYAILGMLSFAASIVCIRSSCIDGIDAWSGFIGRMGVMFFMGLIALADSGFNGGLVVQDHALWKDM
ncbi:hypothetical protein Pmar_PMAR018153 [Perkinsus marinus ATCC 50983]|uniref:EamA domain-containing protein n=1 Tax=Perkinsus marinus (strain ATCC 50983 / TXsc) TaxID=423536 RepID=C5KFW7_PERM5|nr:hypothetical protein Pmar_PMAR018153 [Perkinsus marinus ATCC 50983]EER16615.1 hypothetical protein Pmar_PMAR018153 [Perkinsus marinus ATCC 50983]|eukprot:XP_002784819.1 hypothetical protein Pmar_PMAR018153 [Perkinsus marinus ATCC 50983]